MPAGKEAQILLFPQQSDRCKAGRVLWPTAETAHSGKGLSRSQAQDSWLQSLWLAQVLVGLDSEARAGVCVVRS